MTRRLRFLPALELGEGRVVAELLRQETVGGAVVLAASVIALIWANSPWRDSYQSLIHLELGPMDVAVWAADGLLAIFFYLAGLELKRELLLGSLRNLSDAVVPVVAAACGVAIPALIYAVANLGSEGRPAGWAIPAATDIAFALAVLAVVAPNLPSQLRAFLLSLAIVDDLIVIAVIALFYTEEIHVFWLLAALGGLAVFVFLQRFRGEPWILYVPLALGIWWATHEGGVHATIAGVAMGLATRVRPDEGETSSPAEHLEHTLGPWSAGLAVPIFAFTAAGVELHLGGGFITNPVVLGVVLGLLVGKPAGVLGGAWLATKLTRAELGEGLTWRSIAGVAAVAGIGFTVALLVAELSFSGETADLAKSAILIGSLGAGLLAAVMFRLDRKGHPAGDQEPDTL